MQKLAENGYECYVVGGAVRSTMLNLPVHDYDLTTNALPEQMKEVFSSFRTLETGIKHGTLTVLADHHPLEITTYRKDSAYADHRHPDHVEFTSALKEDCARRDFTVNALCCDAEGNILDFFHGKEDLEKKIIRCIGRADDRFDEDALRILRALRFAARLSFSIDPATSQALHAKKDLLHFISAERIQEETEGFLEAQNCASLLEEYRDVFEVFIPELKNCTETIWNSMLSSIRRSPDDSEIRMAILLGNEEKPENILKRMKYSNASMKRISCMIQCGKMQMNNDADLKRIMNSLNCPFAQFAGYRSAVDPSVSYEEMMEMHQSIMDRKECWNLKDLAIDGNDLKEAGLKGKQIHNALQSALDEVIEKRLPNSRYELLNYINSQKW